MRKFLLATGGSLALWISAKVQVPFYPVPFTMQTFVVLVIGMSFGWRLAAVTVALYLAQGVVGLPVFAGSPEKGIGLTYLAGPTGGYLLGMLPAAALCGWLAELGWDRHVSTSAIAMLAGTTIIYAFGLIWLGSVIGWEMPVLQFGLIPFIPGDALKIVLATIALPLAWKIVNKISSDQK
ncbi:biotin transporter BioY [Neoaquamicrobium sediminum]|uniref:biotin transporter BioY n=1 Tax=Neoaquamicrobium sediminum TaxID=1849104 RepID=UPI00156554DE|nr:biotin transporter BioY [Mesorhizobium sediminum]NRC57274.1 biotin transporter BioY [Mesorhizobium sediminum]